MDYIKNLIKAQKYILIRVKQLEEELADQTSNKYYEKYLKLSEENLTLQEKVHKLEIEAAAANRELEQRNRVIFNLKGLES